MTPHPLYWTGRLVRDKDHRFGRVVEDEDGFFHRHLHIRWSEGGCYTLTLNHTRPNRVDPLKIEWQTAPDQWERICP